MAEVETPRESGSPEEPTNDTNRAMLHRVLLIGVPVLLVLLAGYWFGLRTRYEPILTSVAPDEAAEIVKVLEARKVDYRLGDAGRTILVASGEADRARLELVGSELPVRGQVGFELFNQSDMGLTEFSQKINYQRALQGELARTILLLDGIEAVRVHLGLPERSVFRDEQARPKASVTLILRPGATLTESRVSGIQRLVAGAIPEMASEAVSVLDETGKIVSRQQPDAAALGNSDAIIDGYQRSIGAAIARLQPALHFGVNVSLRMRPPQPASGNGDSTDTPPSPAPRGDPDYAVNVRVTTPAALDDSQRLELIRAIQASAGIDRARGDAIAFLVGDPAPAQPPAVAGSGDRIVAATVRPPVDRPVAPGAGTWFAVAGIAIAMAAAFAYRHRQQRRGHDDRTALTSFADQLRQRLNQLEGKTA